MKVLMVSNEQLEDLKNLVDMLLKIQGVAALEKSVAIFNLLLSAKEITSEEKTITKQE